MTAINQRSVTAGQSLQNIGDGIRTHLMPALDEELVTGGYARLY